MINIISNGSTCAIWFDGQSTIHNIHRSCHIHIARHFDGFVGTNEPSTPTKLSPSFPPSSEGQDEEHEDAFRMYINNKVCFCSHDMCRFAYSIKDCAAFWATVYKSVAKVGYWLCMARAKPCPYWAKCLLWAGGGENKNRPEDSRRLIFAKKTQVLGFLSVALKALCFTVLSSPRGYFLHNVFIHSVEEHFLPFSKPQNSIGRNPHPRPWK